MSGVSVLEAIVALLLGLFVVHLGLSTLAGLRGTQLRLAARGEGLTAMRVARHVLRSELRPGLPGQDWRLDADSISLRAFRGRALVCPRDSATAEVTVAYSGYRRPDPAKDSVLVVEPTGRREARALLGVGPATAGCGSVQVGSLERWTLDAPVAPTVALSALRYRRGASGRQPLTPEVWAETTRWVLAGRRLGIDVRHLSGDAGADWATFVAWTEPE
jgi:hypothetical protein